MASIEPNDNILLIGCGIFPSESIVIAEETGLKVVGIDNSPTAVKHAKDYIEKIDLSHLISIHYADGNSFSVEPYNIIFIAINVFPINKVLVHLSQHLKKGSRILCKSIHHDIPSVLQSEKLTNVFSIIDNIENPRTQSYLLNKNQ
jgi:cyclopropane fatty-acyl-phospholipid synthase-like methyltransferase